MDSFALLVTASNDGRRRHLDRAEEAERPEEGEVDGDEDIKVLLLDELDDDVEAEEDGGTNEREAHGVALRYHLRLRRGAGVLGMGRPLAARRATQRYSRACESSLLVSTSARWQPIQTSSGAMISRCR